MSHIPQSNSPHPVPRDLPDQQAGAGEDRWDPPGGERRPARQDGPDEPDRADVEGTDAPPGDTGTEAGETGTADVPDTDEAGAGPRGAPRQAGVHPEHPVPDEPSG